MKSNNWSKKQNTRRYYLHQRIKRQGYFYSLENRCISVLPGHVEYTPQVKELRDQYGYVIQMRML